MKWHLLLLVLLFGPSASAGAKTEGLGDNPLQSFEPLIGNWQCQAQQMRIELDHFELEYIDAQVRLQMARTPGSQNINFDMHATSGAQEPLFVTRSLITYDPQRSMFVQYESTQGGSDATLYTTGFTGPCVTWRYAADAEALKSSATLSASDIMVEATFCMAEANQSLHIDYTLHLAAYEPFVLFTANCERSTSAD